VGIRGEFQINVGQARPKLKNGFPPRGHQLRSHLDSVSEFAYQERPPWLPYVSQLVEGPPDMLKPLLASPVRLHFFKLKLPDFFRGCCELGVDPARVSVRGL